jgi:stage IV sporulation protein FB
VFLIEPQETPFDLRWRMFGIPVRVHPMFWLVSAILGWRGAQESIQYLLVWIACVFVSILIHELGHVFMGRIFGTHGHIVLYSFGGLAVGSSALSNRWQRILVYFAGPFAGFLLFGIVEVAAKFYPIFVERPAHPLLEEAAWDLVWINLGWGILNLFPIWPLDGGQISRDTLEWVSPQSGVRVSLIISIVFALLLAVGTGLLMQSLFNALFFGMLAFGSYQALQMLRPSRPRWDADEYERAPWERDPDYWKR